MKPTLLNTIGLLAILSCTGCMAVGTQVNRGQADQFRKNVSTSTEVAAALGEPNTTTLLPDGSSLSCYTYIQSTVRPESFIPIVGGFIGGADSRSDMTCFQFTQAGLLKGYTSTSSQVGAGTMLASGVRGDQRVADEPRQAD